MEAEVVVERHADRNRRVGRNVAVGLGLVDHDPRGLVAKPSHVVTHRLAVAESLGVFQIKPEAEVPLDGQRRLESGPHRYRSSAESPAGSSPRRSSAWASGLFARPSSSS